MSGCCVFRYFVSMFAQSDLGAVSDEWLLCVQILCKHVYTE